MSLIYNVRSAVFQPFLRFYAVWVKARLKLLSSFMFQPFLRFYGIRFDPGLRAWCIGVSTLLEILLRDLSTVVVAVSVSTLLEILLTTSRYLVAGRGGKFQPFLRFYGADQGREVGQVLQQVSTLLEILHHTVRAVRVHLPLLVSTLLEILRPGVVAGRPEESLRSFNPS